MEIIEKKIIVQTLQFVKRNPNFIRSYKNQYRMHYILLSQVYFVI